MTLDRSEWDHSVELDARRLSRLRVSRWPAPVDPRVRLRPEPRAQVDACDEVPRLVRVAA